MKYSFLRILSVLLILAILLGNLAMLSFAAQKNTGKRHEICTALSSQAVAYYEKNGFDYDTYISYEGDPTGSCLSAVRSELFGKLHDLMTKTMTTSVTYGSLTGYWKDTDSQQGASNAVLFYSDKVSSNYNREHVWPKSRASFLQTLGGSDLHHLRPTNTNVNSTRSNYCFGNVKEMLTSYETYSYSGNIVLWYDGDFMENSSDKVGSDVLGLVEVNDNIKGDVARVLLYVYVRWEEPNLFENTPNPVIGSDDNKNVGLRVMYDLDTLLEWCEMDPVDTWEMSRNDAIQSVQGNRNVFIDYPELAWYLFGREDELDFVGPGGGGEDCAHETVVFHDAVGYCTETGVKAYYQCAKCRLRFADAECTVRLSQEDLVLAPVGHAWGMGVISIAPTETSTGLMTYRCTRCGHGKSEILPKKVICTGGSQCAVHNFTDVPDGYHWAHDGIEYAVENRLFKGMTDTTFGPDVSMNRAMLVTVLWRNAGSPVEGMINFSDVTPSAWYADAVAWASHNGIVNGMGDGTFAPDAVINREQIATILYRYAIYRSYNTAGGTSLSQFPDGAVVSAYAVDALQWAVAGGLINGISTQGVSYLRPQGSATRAQVATILMRFLEAYH
ncbi:MAG: endonuclease [Oscillospiraceae bacterium]|nr:endonuclease [Oscillospiraceae bacterium]